MSRPTLGSSYEGGATKCRAAICRILKSTLPHYALAWLPYISLRVVISDLQLAYQSYSKFINGNRHAGPSGPGGPTGQQKYGILQTLRPSALSPLALPCSLLVAY